MKKNKTSLGTLGRVLNFLRNENVTEIPEGVNAEQMAYAVITELSENKLKEFIAILNDEADIDNLTDEEGMKIIEDFFLNMGKSLKLFEHRLTADYRLQKNMAIEKMMQAVQETVSQTISTIKPDS